MDIQKEIDYLQTLEAELRQRSTAILSHYAEGADMIPATLSDAADLMREAADSADGSIGWMQTYLETTK